MILYDMIVNRMFGTNCYIFGDSVTRETMIIDPGGNGPEIIKKVAENNLKPIGVILTHGHRDHTGAAKEIRDNYKIPIYCHQKDFRNLGKNTESTVFVDEGDTIKIGSEILHVIYSPGHSAGGIMMVSYENKLVFTGDTLFKGSIGRTDFGGNYEVLMSSIKKLMKNPKINDDFAVLPGHMGESTIGIERTTNMFRNDFL